MKTVMMFAAASLLLISGCASDPQEPASGDGLGQVEQEVGGPCRMDYECPLGERCDLTQPHPLGNGNSWTCVGYAVWGPTPYPCLDTLQCQFQHSWFSHCDRAPGSAHGNCEPD